MEDLWIGLFDTEGITEVSFNVFQSLQSLVIGNSLFRTVTSFEIKNLPSLHSVEVGARCFCTTSSFSLSGLIE